jgi:proteasome lid subunit RPN8/RPN11
MFSPFLSLLFFPKKNWLVVSTPLQNMKVSWDDYSQYMESPEIPWFQSPPTRKPLTSHSDLTRMLKLLPLRWLILTPPSKQGAVNWEQDAIEPRLPMPVTVQSPRFWGHLAISNGSCTTSGMEETILREFEYVLYNQDELIKLRHLMSSWGIS